MLAVLVILGLSIAASIGFTMVFLGGGALMELPGRQAGSNEMSAGLILFAVWQAAAVLLTLIASRLFGGRVRDVLALRPAAGGWRSYLGAIGVLVVLQIALSAVQYATRSGDLYVDLRPFVDLVRGPNWGLAAAVIGIGAPLSEELLFRGFLLSALVQGRTGFWGAAIVSSALWTALHVGYSAVGILEVFVIGLFFSWLLWRTGSLRVAIFCHAVYNSLIVLALRFVDLPASV
jgi:membrane protease YdiL (CAAX protease family)